MSVALPDHRNQEILSSFRLIYALRSLDFLFHYRETPVYLHCLAGRERSPLLAIGLIARMRDIDIFSAIDVVKQCHPSAKPLTQHMQKLDVLLDRLRELNVNELHSWNGPVKDNNLLDA